MTNPINALREIHEKAPSPVSTSDSVVYCADDTFFADGADGDIAKAIVTEHNMFGVLLDLLEAVGPIAFFDFGEKEWCCHVCRKSWPHDGEQKHTDHCKYDAAMKKAREITGE